MIIELGCGNNKITMETPDVVHRSIDHALDIAVLSNDIVGDTSYLPFRDNSIDGFVSQHLIEHHDHKTFNRSMEDAEYGGSLVAFLREVWRCLKPGGFYETICPNFAYIAEQYMIDKSNSLQLMQWAMGGQRDEWDYHKVLLDANLLGHFAQIAGFSSAKLLHPYNWFGLHVEMTK